MIEEKTLQNLLRIFRHCLDHKGVLSMEEEGNLFEELQNPQLRSALSILEEELDVRFLIMDSVAYMIPSFDNTTFGMSLREYREDLGQSARLETAFLISYIQMMIFWLFYGGRNSSNPKQRDFIQMKDLIQEIDDLFARLMKEKETVLAFDSQYRYNFTRIAETWKNKQYGGEGQEFTSKYGTVRRAVNQLRDHGLLTLVEDEVRPTRELTDKFLNYYLREECVQEMNRLFDSVKGE